MVLAATRLPDRRGQRAGNRLSLPAAGKWMKPMARLTLVIGNKNYSSWSLRPWLLLKHLGLPFVEKRVDLTAADVKQQIRRYSPAGRVPVLIDGDNRVWESLAICEYLAERAPAGAVWPETVEARALARAIASEMHSSFAALRTELPMDCRARETGVAVSAAAESDIARVVEIWTDCRRRHQAAGPWLFGRFGAADAMFAPVALRFAAYGIRLPEPAAAYMATVLADPALKAWVAAGQAEPERAAWLERGAGHN